MKKDEIGINILKEAVLKWKEIAGMTILCIFLLPICMLSFAIYIACSLADCIIRKIEKGRSL